MDLTVKVLPENCLLDPSSNRDNHIIAINAETVESDHLWQSINEQIKKKFHVSEDGEYDLLITNNFSRPIECELLQKSNLIHHLRRGQSFSLKTNTFSSPNSVVITEQNLSSRTLSMIIRPRNFFIFRMIVQFDDEEEVHGLFTRRGTFEEWFSCMSEWNMEELSIEVLNSLRTILMTNQLLSKDITKSKTRDLPFQTVTGMSAKEFIALRLNDVFEQYQQQALFQDISAANFHFSTVYSAKNQNKKVLQLTELKFDRFSSSTNNNSSRNGVVKRKREMGISVDLTEVSDSGEFDDATFLQAKKIRKTAHPRNSSSSTIMEVVVLSDDDEAVLNKREVMDIQAMHQNFSFSASKYVGSTTEGTCLICYDQLPLYQFCHQQCSAHHLCCLSCMVRSIRLQVLGSEDTSAQWPSCPLAKMKENGCRYELKESEIFEFLERVSKELTEEESPFPSAELMKVMERVRYLSLRKLGEQENCVRCPKCPNDATAYWVSLPRSSFSPSSSSLLPERRRVDCPFCEISFCSKCASSPYHYFGKCEDLNAITKTWYEWKQGKEELLLKELQASSNPKDQELCAQYQVKLKEQKEQYGEDLNEDEIKEKLAEIEQNEKEMEKTCKICPRCSAPATKISGCDHVICGNGVPLNQGKATGCGQSFNWSTAEKYKTKQVRIDLISFTKANGVRHEIAPEVPMLCDLCKLPIVGPRVRCVNCPSYNICFSCIPKQKPLPAAKKATKESILIMNFREGNDLKAEAQTPQKAEALPGEQSLDPLIISRSSLPRKVKKHKEENGTKANKLMHEIDALPKGMTRRGKSYQPPVITIEDEGEGGAVTADDKEFEGVELPPQKKKSLNSQKKKKKNDPQSMLTKLLNRRYESIQEPVILHDPSSHVCEMLFEKEEIKILPSSSSSDFYDLTHLSDSTNSNSSSSSSNPRPVVDIEEISLLDD